MPGGVKSEAESWSRLAIGHIHMEVMGYKIRKIGKGQTILYALYSEGSGNQGKDDKQRPDRMCDLERSHCVKCGL